MSEKIDDIIIIWLRQPLESSETKGISFYCSPTYIYIENIMHKAGGNHLGYYLVNFIEHVIKDLREKRRSRKNRSLEDLTTSSVSSDASIESESAWICNRECGRCIRNYSTKEFLSSYDTREFQKYRLTKCRAIPRAMSSATRVATLDFRK